jgi:dolichyl-phosphate beta-glucosyltransferase
MVTIVTVPDRVRVPRDGFSNRSMRLISPFGREDDRPPVIDRTHACELSVVIPAFNEANRLPRYLHSVRNYLRFQFGADYEVLVIDDGSTDRQEECVRAIAVGWDQLRYIKHDRNQGKGAAVRTGMLNASGQYHLFADADGATPIQEEAHLRERIREGADCCVASRLLYSKGSLCHRSILRSIGGRCFSLMTRAITGVSVSDTQCGFKMFRAEASRRLFHMSEETGYAFDVEILGLANRLGMRVDEVAVNWSDVPGSKVKLFRDGLQMISDVIRIRRELNRLVPCN